MAIAPIAGSGPLRRSVSLSEVTIRARAMWPRLDARALARCAGDPKRIARLVARRTVLSLENIEAMLVGPDDVERETWFG